MQAVVEDAVLGLAFDDGHGGALFSCGAGAHDAGVAAAHHHDVGLDGLGDLVVGDDGRLAYPGEIVDGGGVGGDGVVGAGVLGTGGGGQGGGGADCHGGRGAGAGDERATGHGGVLAHGVLLCWWKVTAASARRIR